VTLKDEDFQSQVEVDHAKVAVVGRDLVGSHRTEGIVGTVAFEGRSRLVVVEGLLDG
jgi:hypothetical protein